MSCQISGREKRELNIWRQWNYCVLFKCIDKFPPRNRKTLTDTPALTVPATAVMGIQSVLPFYISNYTRRSGVRSEIHFMAKNCSYCKLTSAHFRISALVCSPGQFTTTSTKFASDVLGAIHFPPLVDVPLRAAMVLVPFQCSELVPMTHGLFTSANWKVEWSSHLSLCPSKQHRPALPEVLNKLIGKHSRRKLILIIQGWYFLASDLNRSH